jgi:hypothetical protein
MALTKLAKEAAKKAREKARQLAAKKAAQEAKKKAAAKGKAEVTKAKKPPRVAAGGAGKGGGKEVSPKRQAQIDAEKRLTKRNVTQPAERKSNLSSTAKEVAPRIERLQKLKDAMQSNKKKQTLLCNSKDVCKPHMMVRKPKLHGLKRMTLKALVLLTYKKKWMVTYQKQQL